MRQREPRTLRKKHTRQPAASAGGQEEILALDKEYDVERAGTAAQL